MAANPGLNPSMLRVGQTICLPVSRPPVTCPRGTTSYIIRPGDNLFSIAQRNGTTVAAILAANPGLNPSMLRVGQAICIPVIRSREIYPEGSIPYTIQPGENLYTLAQSFETTPSAILEANPGLNPDLLEAGQTIYMPMSLSQEICSAGNIPYTIQPGENLYTLAQSFGTTPSAILEANPGLNPDLLQAGQTICVSMSRPQEICPAGSTAYTIQPGESIYQIAARFNTSVAAILSLNPGINSTSLESGQTICIPFTDPGRRDEDISEEEAPSQ